MLRTDRFHSRVRFLWIREHHEIVERSVMLHRLSPGLNGLRIVQRTVLHVGNFMKRAKLEWYVRPVMGREGDRVGWQRQRWGAAAECWHSLHKHVVIEAVVRK
jgi:hypothetical protein